MIHKQKHKQTILTIWQRVSGIGLVKYARDEVCKLVRQSDGNWQRKELGNRECGWKGGTERQTVTLSISKHSAAVFLLADRAHPLCQR